LLHVTILTKKILRGQGRKEREEVKGRERLKKEAIEGNTPK